MDFPLRAIESIKINHPRFWLPPPPQTCQKRHFAEDAGEVPCPDDDGGALCQMPFVPNLCGKGRRWVFCGRQEGLGNEIGESESEVC